MNKIIEASIGGFQVIIDADRALPQSPFKEHIHSKNWWVLIFSQYLHWNK